MIAAHTLDSILRTCSKRDIPTHRRKTRTANAVLHQREPADEMTLYQCFHANDIVDLPNVADTSRCSIVGILFAQPNHQIVQDEILPNLDYFHVRSGQTISFYLAGYGAYWQPNHVADMKKVGKVDNTDWYYSNTFFIDLVNSIEKDTKWEYSGECDLILLRIISENGVKKFDFSSCMLLSLEQLSRQGAINSIRNFFEAIFRKATDGPTMLSLADALSKKEASKVLQNFVSTVLPQTKPCLDAYNCLKKFAVTKVG